METKTKKKTKRKWVKPEKFSIQSLGKAHAAPPDECGTGAGAVQTCTDGVGVTGICEPGASGEF